MSESHITNGGSRYQANKVRVAIVGVGNCASAFVQGVEYYRHADPGRQVPGLMHVDLGGYHVGDIEFTAAFDIDARQGRQGPVPGDLGGSEQHHQVRRRPATWASRCTAA